MASANANAGAETRSAPSYEEWAVAPAMRERLACVWAAKLGADGERHVRRIIPDGCIDLLFTEGELIIAGPDTESVAGYTDQPHLTRECRELTALTPAQLLGYPVTAA